MVLCCYGTKDNNAIFGTFASTQEERGYFPGKFEKFRAGKQEKLDFIELTKTAMNSLQNKARDVNFASGGYILFASYVSDTKPFLLVAMIKQRAGIQLNEKLEPVGIQELDLSKLHKAARINVERYLQHEEAEEEDKDQFSYLSFVSPRTNQSASGYFIKALGCSGGVAASRATDSACKETAKFFRKNSELKANVKELKADVLSYLRECYDEKRAASINDLTGIARKHLPANYGDDKRNEMEKELAEHLNSKDVQVPNEFRVHLATINKHAKIKLKTANWQFQFEKHALGSTENAEIWYDKTNNRLVINNLTEETKSAITDD
ncbi:nucleoid-associated protein [Alteromonas sp. KUL42]|nr:nucleoid-associated protein [Alteromonas sp. KUL42]